MKEYRVAITGLGAVTPIGTGIDNFFNEMKSGGNGISKITSFDPTDFHSHMAAEVKDFNPDAFIESKLSKRMDRFTHFGVASADMAFKDAGLVNSVFDGKRAGVIIGSGIGGSNTIGNGYSLLNKNGPKSLSPFFVSKVLINMTACMVSIIYGLKGPLSAPSVACSTGANAIGDAFRIIQRGDADIMLAGGSEACITPLAYAGFCATRSMSRRNDFPEKASRPFDKNRDGFIMGEGSGIVVLEELGHALKRNARIYAELTGYGNTADAYHFTAPEPSGDGMFRVMKQAIQDAGIDVHQVDYINAHGTSTVLNDRIESAAILKLFGQHVKNLKVSSIKSMIGHLLAAAGAVEFVSTVLSIHTGMLPPTINYEEPDPECPLDIVTESTDAGDLEIAISNSFGFGGGNACLVANKYRGET
jgi:3-oxoacyl-[acyl-carrier-protein] synthase II